MRDGILNAHRAERSRRRSRARSSASSTASPTSTTTSTTRSASGILDPADLPRDEIELLGADGLAADRHARPRPGRDLGARGRHRPERRDRRRRCSRCARSCSSASTSARRSRGRARARPRDRPAGSSSTSSTRGDDVDDVDRLRRRHDRPLRAHLRGRVARVVARIKDASVEAVKAAADIVDVVEDARRCARSGGALHGPLPVPRGADAELLGQPGRRSSTTASAAARAATLITFVRETEQLDFAGAIEWLAERFRVDARVRGVVAASATPSGSRRERLLALLEQAAAFYERCLWDSRGGALGARVPRRPRPRRGDLPRVPARARARRAERSARKAREKGFTAEELLAAGLVNRRGNDYFPRRLVFPLADARGRVRGFQARKLHEDDPLQAKYVNSPEGELFRKGEPALRARPRARRRSRSRTARSSSRATPTCSRCARRASSRSSRRWARRSPSASCASSRG